MSETVGFIGLGLMGRPMAKNILKKGYPLVVHSRSQGPVDELVAAGATRAASPADVARQATRIITMVPDSPDVELVLEGPNGVLSAVQPGTIIIDMSSIAPGPARRLAERAKARGATMLDAPVSGGDIGAIAGTLSIMVGGDQQAFDAVKPLLETMGNSEKRCSVDLRRAACSKFTASVRSKARTSRDSRRICLRRTCGTSSRRWPS